MHKLKRGVPMKSLQDFYVEQGVCRTELAEQLGIPEADLQAQEELSVPSEAVQAAISAGFGLAADYFTAEAEAPICLKNGKPIYERAQLRGYFVRVSLAWQFLTLLVVFAPVFLSGLVRLFDFFLHSDFNTTEVLFRNEMFLKAELFITNALMLLAPAFSGIFLIKHITKKTSLQGDLKKYTYFYWLLPQAITAPIYTVASMLIRQDGLHPLSLGQQGVMSAVTLCTYFLNALLCARLLDAVSTETAAKRQSALRLFGGGAAAACVLRFAVTGIGQIVLQKEAGSAVQWIASAAEGVLTVAAAVLVGFVRIQNPKTEAALLKAAPLAAMLIRLPFTVWQILA